MKLKDQEKLELLEIGDPEMWTPTAKAEVPLPVQGPAGHPLEGQSTIA